MNDWYMRAIVCLNWLRTAFVVVTILITLYYLFWFYYDNGMPGWLQSTLAPLYP